MADIEICPCCGQKIVEYRHKLNKVLASGLNKLYKSGASKLKELDLTYSEYANFQKLKYFNLVTSESGTYYITQQGLDFILGKGTAPSFVITKNSEVLVTGPEMYIYEIKDYVQEKVEWQEQATPKMVIENVGGKEHAYLF